MKRAILLALAIFQAAADAAETKEDLSECGIDKVTWGEEIQGAKNTRLVPAEFAGKIIVVEEFGVKTQACLLRLKELVKWQRKMERAKTPAVFIGIHRQRDVPDATIVKEVGRERAESITIRKNGFLPVSIGGMPHAAIFLPDGTMFWHGDSSGREFDRKLNEAHKLAKEKQ